MAPKIAAPADEMLLPRALSEERRRGIEDAIRGIVKFAGAQWERAEAAERELVFLRAVEESRTMRRRRSPRVAEGKAPAHRARLLAVAGAHRYVEHLAKKQKKAAAVKDLLGGMSLPTYRACVRELRDRATDDPELARALKAMGFE